MGRADRLALQLSERPRLPRRQSDLTKAIVHITDAAPPSASGMSEPLTEVSQAPTKVQPRPTK